MDDKLARKKSPDPKQEALRSHKDTWNKEVTQLIAELIVFKRGINGRGDARVGLPPANIKNPLPSEVGSFLLQISERFQKVIEGSRQIIQEQSDYSKTRRKSKKEMPAFTLAADAINYKLQKEASWWWSRLWSYMKNYPKFWNKMLKLRMDTLWQISDLTKLLKEVQDNLISSDENAIPKTIYALSKTAPVIEKLSLLIKTQVLLFSTLSQDTSPKPLPPEEEPVMPELSGSLSTPLISIDFEFLDFVRDENTKAGIVIQAAVAQNKLNENDAKELNKVQKRLDQLSLDLLTLKVDNTRLSNKTESEKIKIKYQEIKDLYATLLSTVATALEISSDQETNFDFLLNFIKTAFDNIQNPALKKMAANFLTRLINRWRIGFLPSPIDKFRLDIFNGITDVKGEVNDLQDLLEDENVELEPILAFTIDIFSHLSDIYNDISKLGNYHNTLHAEKLLEIDKPGSKEIRQKEVNKIAILAKKLALTSENLTTMLADMKKKSEEEAKAVQPEIKETTTDE